MSDLNQALGIDIGGTGIKSAIVDIISGSPTTEVRYQETPVGLGPEMLAGQLADIIRSFNWDGPVGIGYPGVVIDGRTFTAAHLSKEWIRADARTIFSQAFVNRMVILNDADAAGLAEMKFGAGQPMSSDSSGTVLMLTFGTGIGSALFHSGRLVPNTELGHMIVGDTEVENIASGKIKTTLALDWPKWCERVNRVLAEYEKLFSPDMFIIGGGLSENFDKFSPLLKTRAKVVAAELKNNAGLIGAALAAAN